MNHPNQEQLIEFLCAEATPEDAKTIARHLESCPACRVHMDEWREAQSRLTAWSLPERPRRAETRAGLARVTASLRWAAAAVLILSGFGAARLTAPSFRIDSTALRAQVARELRDELRDELQRFTAAQAKRQDLYHHTLTRTLGELEARRLADFAGLRRDVETVAVRTEDELLDTREGLSRLAANVPPRPTSAE